MTTLATIRNCGRKPASDCPREWQKLDVTEDAAVRHCRQCDRLVVLCISDEETISLARDGHVVAREMPDTSSLSCLIEPGTDPSAPANERQMGWKRISREERIDKALVDLPTSGRECPGCGYPVPDYRKTCRVCGLEVGRANSAD